MKKVLPYIVGITAIVIVSGFIGYFISMQQIQKVDLFPNTVESPTDNNIGDNPTFLNGNTADLKTYENNDLGFTFQYPSSYDLSEEETSTTYYVNLIDTYEILTFEILKQSTDNFFSQLPTSRIVSYNGIDWSFHESSKYCDSGECGDTNPGYTTRKNDMLFTLILDKSDADTKTAIQVLSTFKFL
jgi:hypothetical protein